MSKIVFIHSAKCGGNSVQAKFNASNIPYVRIEPETTLAEMPASGLITGHITYDQFFGDMDARFFSVMRSPLERGISHYYYNLAKKNGAEYEIMKDFSLDKFLMQHTVDNIMCRNMFGNKIFDTPDTDANKFEACLKIMRNQYKFIGKLEEMVCVDLWLSNQFKCPYYAAHENKNDHDRDVSPQIRIKFIHRNIVDYMIYEYIGKYWVSKNN